MAKKDKKKNKKKEKRTKRRWKVLVGMSTSAAMGSAVGANFSALDPWEGAVSVPVFTFIGAIGGACAFWVI